MAGTDLEPARLPREWMTPGMTAAQLLAIVGAYRRVIAITAISAMMLAVLFSLIMSKTYVATTTLRIDAPTRDPETGGEISATMAAGFMSTQMDLIHSSRVLLAVVDKLGWDRDPDYASSSDGVERNRQRIAERVLAKNLKVVAGSKDSHLVDLSYAAKTPELAARVANVIAETYIETLSSSSAEPADKRSKAYTEQLDGLRQAVDDAQAKVTAFRNQNGLIELDQTVDAEGKYLLDLNTRLVETQAAERLGQLRMSESRRGAASDTAVLDSPVVQKLKEQLLELESRFAEVSRTLGPNHPDYRALQAEIAVARSRLASETGVYSQSIRQQAGISRSDAAELRAEIAEQREKVLKVRALQEQGAGLRRALEAAKSIYDKALQSYDQVVLGGVRRLPSVGVITEAVAPLNASKPIIRVNLILGLIGGLVCGLIGSFLWELAHRRVRCVDDLERELRLPLLAELPGNALPAPGRALPRPRLP